MAKTQISKSPWFIAIITGAFFVVISYGIKLIPDRSPEMDVYVHDFIIDDQLSVYEISLINVGNKYLYDLEMKIIFDKLIESYAIEDTFEMKGTSNVDSSQFMLKIKEVPQKFNGRIVIVFNDRSHILSQEINANYRFTTQGKMLIEKVNCKFKNQNLIEESYNRYKELFIISTIGICSLFVMLCLIIYFMRRRNVQKNI